MDTDIYTVESSQTPGDLYVNLAEGSPERHQRLYPVLDGNGRLMGILPCSAVLVEKEHLERTVGNSMIAPFAVAYPDEGLRSIAHRMAAHSVGATPVVNRADPAHFLGLITRFDLPKAPRRGAPRPSEC
jgi:CBS domain-containing protein